MLSCRLAITLRIGWVGTSPLPCGREIMATDGTVEHTPRHGLCLAASCSTTQTVAAFIGREVGFYKCHVNKHHEASIAKRLPKNYPSTALA
jgi:hypothetical protein